METPRLYGDLSEWWPLLSAPGDYAEEAAIYRYLEWTWDPDPNDTTYTVDYAYLLRQRDGSTRAVHDRHIEGLFSRGDWLRWLEDAGFEAAVVPIEHSDFGARHV